MPVAPNPEFAKAFEQLRISRGWSPAEVARRLDVYPTEVSRWRRGVGGISIKNVRKIAALFEADRAWLERLAGHGDNESGAIPEVGIHRQVLRDQIDRWLNDVGPENEPLFSDYLTAHGDTGVTLIRQIQSAISVEGHAAISGGVSSQAKRGRSPKNPGKGPLTGGQLATKDLVSGRMTSVGQHRLLANSRLAA